MTEDPQAAPSRSAAVIGASFSGMLTAVAAAQAGYQVTLLERDRLPDDATARGGVPQSEQAHILLRRGLIAIESLLPGIGEELVERGGVPFNTGQMLWLGEHGWLPQTDWAFEIISISRPLLELAVRERVRRQRGIHIHEGFRVAGLARAASNRWVIHDPDGEVVTADLVIDASGRTSRLPHWLADLGITVPEPEVVDAHLGYATRRYRGRLPFRAGAVVVATPQTLRGALLLPIEQDRWLVCAAGYGDDRPSREAAEFDDYLASLRDPAVADAVRELEPEGDIAIHRQTANRRFPYGRARDWPAGLLVVGDAMCAFNPVYGQGITVGVSQAEVLRAELERQLPDQHHTRRIQRKLAALVDLPWSVATSEDLRMPTSPGHRSPGQELTARWVTRMGRLAAAGDETCTRAISHVYHLMGSPLLLLSPRVTAKVLRSLTRPLPPPAPRPAVLSALSGSRSRSA